MSYLYILFISTCRTYKKSWSCQKIEGLLHIHGIYNSVEVSVTIIIVDCNVIVEDHFSDREIIVDRNM